MGSVADDIGPETAVRPPPRDPASVPSKTAAALPAQQPRPQAEASRPAPLPEVERRYRQTIHRVDLWSVLKISVCFYICGMAVTSNCPRSSGWSSGRSTIGYRSAGSTLRSCVTHCSHW